MEAVLIEYIETEHFGKIAHFINTDGKHIYSKILTSEDTVYYQELSSNELELIMDEIKDGKNN